MRAHTPSLQHHTCSSTQQPAVQRTQRAAPSIQDTLTQVNSAHPSGRVEADNEVVLYGSLETLLRLAESLFQNITTQVSCV